MESLDRSFTALPATTPVAVGMVLRGGSDDARHYMRITHVFERSIYVMPVSTADQARYARRPKRMRTLQVEQQRTLRQLTLGRLGLPRALIKPIAPDADDAQLVESAKETIEPLLALFSKEANLDSRIFTRLIDDRAASLGMSFTSVRRLLLRNWYFGGVERGLLRLAPGVAVRAPDSGKSRTTVTLSGLPRKRAGARSRLERTRGRNEFIVTDEDIDDMLIALTRCAKGGVGAMTEIHKSYLSTEFKLRHRKIYGLWTRAKIVMPVTLRQFRRYVRQYEELSDELRARVPALTKVESATALRSTGPGDVYELDATGGQIFVVDSKDPRRILRKATIYILIDRWSRYIVAIYVTLEPPSWEALRILMRIAFTSRERRFANLGFAIKDSRWMPGVVPAEITVDRGSEMISKAMLDSAVKGLRITANVLPALTPDGKAIVERVIGVLKKKLKNRGTPGMYPKTVLDPKAKSTKRRALRAAVYTLKELYRALVDIVDDHNHAVHSSLERRAILRTNRVAPTPIEAYKWGLRHLTGIRRPPLSDEDYDRLLLGPDRASLINGVIHYRGRRYFPANATAMRDARRARIGQRTAAYRPLPKRQKPKDRAGNIAIALDRSDPVELYTPTDDVEWPKWTVDDEGLANLRNITLEEEDSLGDEHKTLIADVADRALAEQVGKAGDRISRPKRGRQVASEETEPPEIKRQRSQAESDDLKRALSGQERSSSPSARRHGAAVPESWQAIEQREREALIQRNRKRRQG